MASCAHCSKKFSWLYKTHVCGTCSAVCCRWCIVRSNSGGNGGVNNFCVGGSKVCRRCDRLLNTACSPSRPELLQLPVRDLLHVAHMLHLSTSLCKEKRDLIDLIVGDDGLCSSLRDNVPTAAAATTTTVEETSTTTANVEETTTEVEQFSDHVSVETVSVSDGAEPVPSVDASEPAPEPAEPEPIDVVTVPDDDEPVPEELDANEVYLSCVSDLSLVSGDRQLHQLSVRQCRLVLARYRVSTHGFLERQEFVQRLIQLWRDLRRNRLAAETAGDELLCKVCWTSLTDCVLLECGHLCCCTDCGKQMAECPLCRTLVSRVVHVFRS